MTGIDMIDIDMTTRMWLNLDMTGSDRTNLDMINSDKLTGIPGIY